MTDEQLYAVAYNAHEHADHAAHLAIRAVLETCSVDSLMCLADPQWRWETRSFLSPCITDAADDVLTAKLEQAVEDAVPAGP